VYALGTQESASWNPGAETGGIPTVIYSAGDRRTLVLLRCSTTGTEEFEVLGEDPVNTYIFRLTHKCACWDGCSSSTTTTLAPTTVPPIINSCRFEYPGKGVIDFSFIGRTDEKAAYTDEMTRTVSNFSMFIRFCILLMKFIMKQCFFIIEYSYNPCRSFSQGTGCIGVSVCQSQLIRSIICLIYILYCI